MKNPLRRFALETLAAALWLAVLRDTNAYYSPYLILGIAGIGCSAVNCFRPCPGLTNTNKAHRVFRDALSSLFSVASAAANYSLFTDPAAAELTGSVTKCVYGILLLLLCLTGGFVVFRSVLRFLEERSEIISCSVFSCPKNRGGAGRAFLITAVLITAVDCLVLFLTRYPGVLTEDSISQIGQLLSGSYSNHHPYYHTLIIKLCIKAGLAVFGNMNAAVAVYSVVQIVAVACSFGYVISTLYLMGGNKKLLAVFLCFYLILPCHVIYSFTMWKDVLFGASVCVFLVTQFRLLNKIGKCGAGAWILLVISGLGSCLLRTNGWMTFAASFLFLFLFLFRRNKKLCAAVFGILALSFVLKNPVLNALGVRRTDTIESLSIPAQQVARTIKECKDELTPGQRELLDKIVDVDRVYLWYSEFISNPVKDLVRLTGDQEYLSSHMRDYLKMYIEIGIAHPKQYFEAWVEQTKGYWNSGYPYWIVSDLVSENDFGISRTVVSGPLEALLNQYVNLFGASELLSPLQSIGLYVWIMLALMAAALTHGKKTAAAVFVPLVIYLASLLIATPVFAEFRYTYVIFCAFPFLICAPFYGGEN